MDENSHKTAIKIIATVLSIALLISVMVFIPKGAKETAKVSAQTDYIQKVFDRGKVNQINIEMPESDWDWLMKNAIKEEYKSCNITINGEKFYNVGIRTKGNSSLMQLANGGKEQRFSFRLNFSKYVKGQTYHGLNDMVLNNIMSDKSYMKEYLSFELFDFIGVPSPAYAYSNIKVNNKDWGLYLAVEVIAEDFIERQFGSVDGNLYKPESMDMGGGNKDGNGGPPDGKAFKGGGMPFGPGNDRGGGQNNNGIQTQRNKDRIKAPANGGRQEADTATAPLSRDFSDNKNQQNNDPNFGGNQGNMPNFGGFGGRGARGGADLKYTDDSPSSYSTIKDGAVFDTTKDSDFKKVIEMIKNLNNGTNLEKYLDVHEILRFWAANTFLVNLDSYAGGMYHNYYLYEKNGVFKLLPWDFNLSFAGMGPGSSSSAINFPIDKPVNGNLEDAPLIGKLLEVPEYKEAYHGYLKEIVEKYINSGVYEASINNINKLISDYVKNDATAFYTFDEYKKAVPAMVTFGKDRAASITAQLNGTQPSTSYGNITTTLNISDLGSMGFGRPGGDNAKQQGNMQPPGNMPQGNMQSPGNAPQQGDMANQNNMQPPGGIQPGNMPAFENMQEIMQIVEDANGGEFTDSQKKKLEELGVDENMINMFRNMPKGGMFQGDMPKGGVFQGGMPRNTSNGDRSFQYVILAISAGVLIIGIIFVINFRRKRYVICK
jgi:spore coat protein CotH